jgi:small GTP-binding protein
LKQLTKKICLIGDFAVGKTSLVRRFTESRFDEHYLSTIGVRVSRKATSLTPEITLTMMIWDTAGGEAFNHIVRTYYQGASGALLVCDLTRIETVTGLVGYASDFLSVNPGAPLVIIGNKLDLAGQHMVSLERLADLARVLGAPWVRSSAKTGDGVDQAFHTLGTAICSERSIG